MTRTPDRGATQQTFDFGDEDERTLPAYFLRPEATDPAFADTPSLSVSSDADLMEQMVDPQNLERAWRQQTEPGSSRSRRHDDQSVRKLLMLCVEHALTD